MLTILEIRIGLTDIPVGVAIVVAIVVTLLLTALRLSMARRYEDKAISGKLTRVDSMTKKGDNFHGRVWINGKYYPYTTSRVSWPSENPFEAKIIAPGVNSLLVADAKHKIRQMAKEKAKT